MVYRENAMRLSPQRTAETAEGEEGTTVSTLQKPMPAWTGTAMQVTCPNFLQDAWDASESFAEAFCSVYQTICDGYEQAAAEGRLPTTHDVVADECTPATELQKALLRGEGWLGSVELARRYECHRSTVARVAGDLGITLRPRKGAARDVAEAHFRDGETRPRVILAAIAEALPDSEPPKRNTITQWRIRWERLQKP